MKLEKTELAKELNELRTKLSAHLAESRQIEMDIKERIKNVSVALFSSEENIDFEKIALAKTIVCVEGLYSKGGEARDSVVRDAITYFATKHARRGLSRRGLYNDLWRCRYATKNYDRWQGQRADCEYGYEPRHGYICFSVGIVTYVRSELEFSDLTPEEIEASIYYLSNLEKVQEIEAKANC